MAHYREEQERGRRGRNRWSEDEEERRGRESQSEREGYERDRMAGEGGHERSRYFGQPGSYAPPQHESEPERFGARRRFERFGDRFADRLGERFEQPRPQFDDPFGGRRDAFGDSGPERRGEERHEWWRQEQPQREWSREGAGQEFGRDQERGREFGRGQEFGRGPSFGGSLGPQYGDRGRFSGRGPKNYKRSDERVLEDVNQALEDHPEVDASEIEVTCQGGEIVLRGSVPDRRAKRLAEDCAENLRGVKDVRNELRVTQAHGQQGQSDESRTGESSWSQAGQAGQQSRPGSSKHNE